MSKKSKKQPKPSVYLSKSVQLALVLGILTILVVIATNHTGATDIVVILQALKDLINSLNRH